MGACLLDANITSLDSAVHHNPCMMTLGAGTTHANATPVRKLDKRNATKVALLAIRDHPRVRGDCARGVRMQPATLQSALALR